MDNSRNWAASKYREGGEVTASDPQYGAISYHNEPTDPPQYAGGGKVQHFAGGNLVKKALKKASEVFGEHEGKHLNITQTDRMRVGDGDLGGPGFPTLAETNPEYEGVVWGVGNPAVASTMINADKRFPKGQSVWTTMLGSPEQHRSNQHTFDALYKEFKKAARAGKLDPVLHQAMNDRLKQAVDKEGIPLFPEDVDILDRKFKDFADRFDKRAVAADVLAGVGIGGKKSQIFDYDKVMQKMTDPLVKDSPTGSLGYRLFNLSGERSERPDLHSAFPHILHGEDFGVSYDPAPRELVMQKWIDDFVAKNNRQPSLLDWTRGYAPSTQITDEMLTRLQKEGYAKGGKVELEDEFKKANAVDMTGFRTDPIAMAVDKSKAEPSYKTLGRMAKKVLSAPIELGRSLGEEEAAHAKNVGLKQYAKDVARNVAADLSGQLEESNVPYSFYKSLLADDKRPIREQVLGETPELPVSTLAAEIASPGAAVKAVRGATKLAPDIARTVEKYTVDPYKMNVVEPGNRMLKEVLKEMQGTPNVGKGGFYSPLEKFIASGKLDNAPKDQWMNYINANAPKGAKKEAQWSMLDKLPEGKLTKEDVIAHINAKQPEIKKVERHEGAGWTPLSSYGTTSLQMDRREYARIGTSLSNRGIYTYEDDKGVKRMIKADSLEDAKKQAEQFAGLENVGDYAPVRFPTLQLKGPKENYRENLLVLEPKQEFDPEKYKVTKVIGSLEDGYIAETPSTRSQIFKTKDEAEAQLQKYMNNSKPKMFEHHHWPDNPNVVAHYRTNVRPVEGGGTSLHVDEAQSDWSQRIRDVRQDEIDKLIYGGYSEEDANRMIPQGFGIKRAQEDLKADIARVSDEKWKAFDEFQDMKRNPSSYTEEEAKNIKKKFYDAQDKYETLMAEEMSYHNMVAKAPHVEDTADYTKLIARNAIKDAIEGGHTHITWTGGEQQADRYKLSKLMNRIEVRRIPESNTDEPLWSVYGQKNDGQYVDLGEMDMSKMRTYLGKDISRKVLKGEGLDPASGSHVFENLDTPVGGEGMRAYYDTHFVPKAMRDAFKELGVDVTPTTVPISKGEAVEGFDPLTHAGDQMGIKIPQEAIDAYYEKGFPKYNEGGEVHMAPGGSVIKKVAQKVGKALEKDEGLPKRIAYNTYEQVPYAGARHLEGMPDVPFTQKSEFSEYSPWNQGDRDLLAEYLGLKSEAPQKGVGLYQPPIEGAGMEINPQVSTRTQVELDMPHRWRNEMTEPSKGSMSALGATRGYLDVQGAAPWVRPSEGGKRQYNAFHVVLSGKPTPEDMTKLAEVQNKYGFYGTSDLGKSGVFIGFNFDYGPKHMREIKNAFEADVRDALGDRVKGVKVVKTEGDYPGFEGKWEQPQGKGEATRQLMEHLSGAAEKNPLLEEFYAQKPSSELQKLMESMNIRDIEAPAKYGVGEPRKDVLNAREIFAREGVEGLRRALERGEYLPAVGAIPVGLDALNDKR